MLTSEHVIVAYERGRAYPDRLYRGRHTHYLDYVERALTVYRSGEGRSRRELHRDVEALFADEPDCESRRVRAFCKLLDDLSTYDTDRRGRAANLRLQVFSRAARFHPLVTSPDRLFDHSAESVKEQIAGELERPWEEIEASLYLDVIECQRLISFEGVTDAAAFLSRYNVAQVQGCLYRATRMVVEARRDFKTILRYAKLARLLHIVRQLGPSHYRIDFSGPASVLRQSRRYGVAMAKFLPSLLACDEWSLRAQLEPRPGFHAVLELTSEDGLTSHLPTPEEFDSKLERKFADKFGAERDDWRLERESEIICENQTAFLPDFVFRHRDGTTVLFEIVGFWTPEYLAKKRETLRKFKHHRILLAVAESSIREGATIPDSVLTYKTAIKLGPILEALERFRPSD